MADLNLVTVNFNTPEYIFSLFKSLKKYNSWVDGSLTVYDNSPTGKMPAGNFGGFNVRHVSEHIYDQINALPKPSVPAAGNYNSARHARTIDLMLAECSAQYCLLVDSDIIFTRSFLPEFTRFKESHAFMMGYKRSTYHTPCIAPWCCFINMEQYRSYKLKFFDMTRMLYINDNRDYDTGGSLYEDAERLNLPIIITEDNTFYIHFKGGSVFKERGLLWLRKNQAIWS